jgi:thymidylate synthase
MHIDKIYHDLLRDTLENGVQQQDRTGVGTTNVIGRQFRVDLNEGFPAITTKKLYWNGVITELLWFLKGDINIKYLHDHNTHIWDAWANEEGNLIGCYPAQWRRWKRSDGSTFDQIAYVVKELKTNPLSRRIILNAWNPGEIETSSFLWCHSQVQFLVLGNKLFCLVNQRAADQMLGIPFNIASYALLTHMLAQVCNLQLGELIFSLGSAHIYNSHLEQVKELLTRTEYYPLPTLKLNPDIKNIDDFKHEDIELIGYKSHATIKAPISV